MGLISQSGALAFELIETRPAHAVCITVKGSATAMRLILTNVIYLEYSPQDNETKLVVMYIEGVRDGKRFLDVLQKNNREETGESFSKAGRGKSGTRRNCLPPDNLWLVRRKSGKQP